MSDEESSPQVSFGGYSTQADRSVQEFRLDLTPIFLDMRTALTGCVYRGGKWVKIREESNPMVCLRHWEDYSSNILIEIDRSMMLSKLHEQIAEKITADFGRRSLAWLASHCLFCPDCGFNGNYTALSMLAFSITDKLYYNLNRAVEGHESKMLSTMQTIATHETYNREGGGGGGFFRRRNK